ncbi:Transglycosylase-like domain protein (plasmid) [Pseudonocardia dioxanivorans CB1190]|uniref:Transglycosylase-like domain protein n=1 Tax=Pseudonocardia dioxanivorans (strain ATCC 55486 / DSM 44775 / JCM 13855 / CB1190) TaxID=675635 RepID=F2L742_PSEUX|nr:transglycosylase [Pseudonocardia dioxanivorans]AEA29015.1 Transglycosylase-like domain protein [Pseudonocardia dioxanivorans CB1190]
MPVTTTVGALAVAAALAAGPALTTTPALVADQTDNRTCTVQTSTGNTSTSTGTGGTGTGGTGASGTGQLTPDQAAQLLEQTRELVTSLTLAGADARAAALGSGIRALGITPSVASGWEQQAHDLADTTLAAMGDDPAAGALAVALAKAGYSPTPADLRTDTNKAPDTSASTATGTASGQDAAADGGSGPAIAPSAAVGSVLLAGGALAAAIRALPADGFEACGLDSTTDSTTGTSTSGGSSADGAAGTGDWSSQADALLAQLTGDSDPAARQLAQIIEQARASGTGTGNTVNNQVTERGNNGSTTSDSGATSTGTGTTSTDAGGTDAGGTDTGSTGQGSTGSTTGGDTAPGGGGATGSGATTGANDPATDQTSTGGAGAAGQAWEAKAQKLADELSSAGDDPVARNLSEQLAAQGITGRAQQAGTTNPTDTTSTGTNSGDSSSTSDSADQGGGDSDQPSDQDTDSGQQGADDQQSSDGQDQKQDESENQKSQDDGASDQDSTDQSSTDQAAQDDQPAGDQAGGDKQSGPDAGTSTNTVWDRLASCESGNNWRAAGGSYSGVIRTDRTQSEAGHSCAGDVQAVLVGITNSMRASLISRLGSPFAWRTKS